MNERARNISEAVTMIRAAFGPGPGRGRRLLGLGIALSSLSQADRNAAFIEAGQRTIADLADRFDPRSGHCMHNDPRSNCFRAPCAQCPDHPANHSRVMRRRLT